MHSRVGVEEEGRVVLISISYSYVVMCDVLFACFARLLGVCVLNLRCICFSKGSSEQNEDIGIRHGRQYSFSIHCVHIFSVKSTSLHTQRIITYIAVLQ